ncbi:FeoA family protein [Sulfurovum sp. CS9]|jgi:Fe2+ transport system protein FeoA|uniref:FeoA family protein n=1 Tax=Sulfurovum sp. CS9 TaxID=3391146 RepID=UPI0039EA2F01
MEITLFDLESGKKATIKRLDGGVEFQKKLTSLNIRIGKTIRKITAQPLHGPIVIEIDNTEAAIGINMAKKIVVVPLETE